MTESSSVEAPKSPSTSLERVAELWFDDGTIILQAGSSIFRVYKGLLAARSPVFMDMLSMPEPDEIETMEGCPLVQLHDSAEDLTHFLRCIHDFTFFETGKQTDFAIVAGVLRLSTKYDIPYLRRLAIIHLISAYPTTLQGWDSRSTRRTIPAIPYIPFAVLELARATSVESILPAAMYCCCTCSSQDIIDGVTWNGAHLDMDPADKRTCVIARQSLLTAKAHTISSFLKPCEVPGCTTRDACNTGRLKGVFSNADDEYCDPFWDRFDWDQFARFVCAPCLAVSKNSYEKARAELWADLPRIFNLHSWSDLEASDFETSHA